MLQMLLYILLSPCPVYADLYTRVDIFEFGNFESTAASDSKSMNRFPNSKYIYVKPICRFFIAFQCGITSVKLIHLPTS